jgi:hypothetical protein
VSREIRRIDIAVTTKKPEHLPLKDDGEQMYADDVVEELSAVIDAAVHAWYVERGHQLIEFDPT